MKMVPLKEVAPARPRANGIPLDKVVWHLTLDQIESGSGNIVSPVYEPAQNAGNSTFAFGPEHVLYSKLRPNLNKVICPEEVGIATTELVPLCPDPTVLDRRYLCYYLRSPAFVNWASGCVAGAKMPRVQMKAFWEREIPLLPLAEQKCIATILNQADAIRRKRREAIQAANDLIPAIFYEMFGDPVLNTKGWERQPLVELIDFMTSGSRGWARYYAQNGPLFLRIQNVGRNELFLEDVVYVNPPSGAEAKRTRTSPGDMLISVTADLGRTAVIPEDLGEAYINQHLVLVRLAETVNPLFVSQFLASMGGQAQFERLNRVGVKAGLNFDDVRSITILCPPRPLQDEFANRLQQVRSVLQPKLKDAVSEAENLFNSLAQRAFRGEL